MNEQEKLDNLQKLLQERNINISDFSRARIKIFNGAKIGRVLNICK